MTKLARRLARRTLLLGGAGLALLGCSPAGLLNGVSRIAGDGGVRVAVRGAAYGPDPRHRLDVYVPAGRYVVWSDIPNDRMLRWDETTGNVGEFRSPAGYSNGNMLDRQGRLVSCEHGNRRVSRTEHDGSISTIADRFDGKRFNSPNDLIVRSDDSA